MVRAARAPLGRRQKLGIVSAAAFVVVGASLGIHSVLSSRAATTTTPAGMRTLPDPLYGVTVDDVSNTAAIVASSKALSRKPITRIVFDEGQAASQYTQAVNAIQPDSYIMGELLDSEGLAKSSLQQYHDRTAQYLGAFGSKVDLWEVGNEVNGDWTGDYASVGAKINDAHVQVKAAGKRSALTLWYNPNCKGSSRELDPLAFSRQYVPESMRQNLDYVFISYYETQCNDYRPTEAVLNTFFSDLRALYPNSKLGFGEVGLPDAAKAATQSKADSILNYYYSLKINVPGYVGGYFWWYYYQDMLPHTGKPMWAKLNALFAAMPGGGTPVPTAMPTATPIRTPVATATPTRTPVATMTPTSTPVITRTPLTTATPLPTTPPTGGTKRGDVNGDGRVNVLDLSALLSKWGTANAAADINGDGKVGVLDLSALLSTWGS